MPPQVQTRIDTLIKENSGTINITYNKVGRPPKPPAETYGNPKGIRFQPRDEKQVDNAVRCDDWESYQKFGEFWLAKVGTLYNKEQAEKLERHFQIIAPLLDRLP